MKSSAASLFLCATVLGFLGGKPAWAQRDAAFMTPSASIARGASRDDSAVKVEPKSDIDLGEVAPNVGKRTTLFFVNQSNVPVSVLNVTANGDSTVDAEIVSDDCSKQKKIEPSDRCAVSVEVTPKTAGTWTTEVLLTHNGSGRFARARISGKSTGGADKKETGLSLSTKDIKPVDFGEVEVGTGKAVRSALMVNDSPEPITLYAIDVIAAENGLQRLDQGCLPDMELKPGESCPVTLVWNPTNQGAVSTDLIIRHSGQRGFAVIPIRGQAKAAKDAGGDSKEAKDTKDKGKDKISGVPMSPTADELEKMIAKGAVPQLPAAEIPPMASAAANGDGRMHLIGTIGNRALFYLPDGTTSSFGIGDEIPLGSDKDAKLTNVMSKSAEVFIDGKKKTYPLEAASALTHRALQEASEKRSAVKAPSSSGAASSVGINGLPAPKAP